MVALVVIRELSFYRMITQVLQIKDEKLHKFV